ncbi:MAG: hypothetical protein RIR00_432 [Pseudomonadota bacterium]|jgi:hypothetical protein
MTPLPRPSRLYLGSRHFRLDAAGPAAVVGEGLGDDPAGWAAALKRLATDPRLPPGPRQLLISDRWVRYDLLPVATRQLGEDEARLLAESRFRRQYGAPLWPLRLAAAPAHLLSLALQPALLAALEAQQAELGLCGVEPWFAALWDRAWPQLRQFRGWLLVDEEDILLLAQVDHGRLLGLRSQLSSPSQPADPLELLTRQAALAPDAGHQVLIHSLNPPPTLPAPWQGQALVLPPAPGAGARLWQWLRHG